MGLKRGGFIARAQPLVSKSVLKADPSKPLARTRGLDRTGLTRGVPAQRKATPQQARRKAKQAEWPKVRDLVLERDDWSCVRCGRSDLRLEVHHRRHRSQGGEDVPSNLVSLCGWGNHSGDHGWAHNYANTDAAAVGLSVVWGSEPEDVEVLYPDGRRYLLTDSGERVPA